jgi:protein TonB
MFHENLLESSHQSRKHKPWPMAAAFAGEVIVGGALILVPLLTTGVIPVSAHVVACPLGSVHVARQSPTKGGSTSGAVQPARALVILANNNHRAIRVDDGHNQDSGEVSFPTIGDPRGNNVPLTDGNYTPPVQEKPVRRLIVSNLSEAQLLNRVEPVYPRIAVLTRRQGDVKLHAFIAKNGSIESLSVISGDPLLANAALEAVRQWRYRPYLLNGEPVEVETFITVSFKGIRD